MASNTTTVHSSRQSLTPVTSRRWKHQNLAGAVSVILHNSDHKKHSSINSPVNFRQSLMKNEISARKLAAGLWKLRFVEVSGDGDADGLFSSSKSKVEDSMGCIKSPKEEATKWNPTLNEYDSVVTVLLEELLQAKNSINKLKAAQKSSKKKAKQLLQTLEEEKVKWKSRELHKFEALFDELKNKLARERRSRERMEKVNEKLVNELAAANESAKQFMANYEKEKRERELTEEVCDELAQKLGEDKAKVEMLMWEVEEEREMMRITDQLREERVYMKLSDARYLVEEKYNQMLRSKGCEESQLEEAIESTREYFYDLSKSSNEGLKEYNESPTPTGPLSTIIHIENVDVEGLKLNKNYMSYQSSGLGGTPNSPEPCHEEGEFSTGSQMVEGDRDTCVINGNKLRSCPNDESTIIPDTRYSQYRYIQGDGWKKLKEAKNSIEDGVGTSNNSSINNIMNPHITRGMRGCIEWPRGVPKTNSKALWKKW